MDKTVWVKTERKKCELLIPEIKYLIQIINKNGCRSDPGKNRSFRIYTRSDGHSHINIFVHDKLL